MSRALAVGVAALALTLIWGCGGDASNDASNDADSTASASAVGSARADGSTAGANEGAPSAGIAELSGDTSGSDAAAELTGDPAVDSILAAIRACPRDGLWHECSLQQRLERSGLRVETVDTATTIPGLPQPAHTWQVGRQLLRLVLFPSAAEAALAMERMDVRRAAPKDDPSVSWPDRATMLHNANLIAVLLGGSDRQVERVSNALLAGAPQPETEPPF